MKTLSRQGRRVAAGLSGPPACVDDLLAFLRAGGLLAESALVRLWEAWDANAPAGPHIDQLVSAGLLTAYQAEQVRQGRLRTLRMGPYRLLEPLGAGSEAAVFRAEHHTCGRTVALKVFEERHIRQRPVELQAAGRFAHRHIVATYPHLSGRLGGKFVLAVEQVEGIDLGRLLAETSPPPVWLACEIVRQIALGLAYLHQRGFLHRDIKPDNLMLTDDERGRPVVKILDLGLSCPVGTEVDRVVGTLDYLAPECAQTGECLDGRADLYSLGCVFYQLLTGRVPFPGGTAQGKLLRHRLEEPEAIDRLRPEVPAEVVLLVERLMQRDREDRPGDAAAIAKELARLRWWRRPVVPWRRLVGLAILAGSALGVIARLVLGG